MPKAIHRDTRQADEADRMLDVFLAEVKRMLRDKILNHRFEWKRNTLPGLLDLRKQLNRTIRTGMTKREDLEIEIGMFAALVWKNRMVIEHALMESFEAEPYAEGDLDRVAERAEKEAWTDVGKTGR
uniref:Uncharacterized protein n=1 Tax=viral metagenome TaxID=1070528 RepID=A0A6M3M622_9ZZZZ